MDDRMILGEPISRLIGYCNSAAALEKDSRLKEWSECLIELAKNLDTSWEKVLANPQTRSHGGEDE